MSNNDEHRESGDEESRAPSDDNALMARAIDATDRGGLARFKQAQGADLDDAQVTALFRAQTPLRELPLRELSLRLLEAARGRRVGCDQRFPATMWLGGATDAHDGRDFLGTVSQFAMLLEERATKIHPKRTGWVVEPTTNPSGRRTNQATLAVHALFLDCDGAGEWNELVDALNSLDYCYIAYQSSGWTPTNPKWRIILPLSEPFDTSSDARREIWKILYHGCRVVFGSAGNLVGAGFDPATDTPCNPWFLTERANADDPLRRVMWRPGHALDMTALAIELPPPRELPQIVGSGSAEEIELGEERLAQLVEALIAATSNVSSGRRDLYLALPGALLDRGVHPDDVMSIIEVVSASYPRSHPEKHADNLHNARTTIAKWEASGRYTRIGTLNTIAPKVAAVLDEFLPDLASKMIVESVEVMLQSPTSTPPASCITPTTTASPIRRRKASELSREVSAISSRLRAAKRDPKRRLSGILVKCLATEVAMPCSTEMSHDEMTASAMRALGQHLLLKFGWQEVLDFAGTSLSLMGIAQSIERVARAERAFYEGRGKRNRLNDKRAAEAAKLREQSRAFFDEIDQKEKGQQ